jgi:hypothetical protein
VIAGNNIPDIPDYADLDSLRVHAPTLVVFICGGAMDVKAATPPSLRDAFMRVIYKSPLANYNCVLAEDPDIFSPRGEYIELLEFETDVAQLSELLVRRS